MNISKNDQVLFICRSGARSLYTVEKVQNSGYPHVYNVEDGFSFGWKGWWSSFKDLSFSFI